MDLHCGPRNTYVLSSVEIPEVGGMLGMMRVCLCPPKDSQKPVDGVLHVGRLRAPLLDNILSLCETHVSHHSSWSSIGQYDIPCQFR